MARARHADVIVIGAGVAGTACAHALAPDHDVLVLDRGAVGGDTTSKASGVITTPSVFPDAPAIGDHAISFFRDFDGTGVYRWHDRPKVQPVRPEEADRARRIGEREGRRFVPLDDVPDRYGPIFGDLSGYVGILEYADAGWIRPADYTSSLAFAAEEQGAEFRTGVSVTGVSVADGAVTGVETEYGPLGADTVVCAAGWRTRALLSDLIALPIRPFRWNAVVLEPTIEVDDRYPIGAVGAMRIYWRPTREGYVLVGGNEHVVDDPVGAPAAVDEPFHRTVREDVGALLRGLSDAAVVREDCCPSGDTATPDTWPIIDAPVEAPDGLVVATGFHGRGVMTSPVTGTAVRSLVTGEDAPFPTDRFRLARFDDRSADFPFVSEFETLYDVDP